VGRKTKKGGKKTDVKEDDKRQIKETGIKGQIKLIIRRYDK
jgi:hypothetical protein